MKTDNLVESLGLVAPTRLHSALLLVCLYALLALHLCFSLWLSALSPLARCIHALCGLPRCCPALSVLISHKVSIKSFGKSQFPHKSVNLSFIITDIKNKSTDLCGTNSVKLINKYNL